MDELYIKSPPAYHLDRGSGAGINNWLIQLEGGGWCNNITTCLARRNNRLGSSKRMAPQLAFSGLLGHRGRFNPDFYNWNRVKIRYCDGSSFTGDVEAVDPATNLHYRGARVWLAVIEDLLENGMKKAENALLSGCSAGGLASILHCDSFRSLMPMGAKPIAKAVADWFYDRTPFQKIDCPYPCDSSCHNSIFGPPERPQEHSEA
ncbi:hypothetical protein QJS04_geneDACA012249 [Acorus gramineus]|uniref:Pectin acetylesterase n=1 Tax=Acorus gramineus TaxID=55184 RepID=A0AAV9BCR3_ACOGR|nr:hypothetical protein QJS04_geneDACA012249 [Acorus gramineus]